THADSNSHHLTYLSSTAPPTPPISPLSLHDALPISHTFGVPKLSTTQAYNSSVVRLAESTPQNALSGSMSLLFSESFCSSPLLLSFPLSPGVSELLFPKAKNNNGSANKIEANITHSNGRSVIYSPPYYVQYASSTRWVS